MTACLQAQPMQREKARPEKKTGKKNKQATLVAEDITGIFSGASFRKYEHHRAWGKGSFGKKNKAMIKKQKPFPLSLSLFRF